MEGVYIKGGSVKGGSVEGGSVEGRSIEGFAEVWNCCKLFTLGEIPVSPFEKKWQSQITQEITSNNLLYEKQAGIPGTSFKWVGRLRTNV